MQTIPSFMYLNIQFLSAHFNYFLNTTCQLMISWNEHRQTNQGSFKTKTQSIKSAKTSAVISCLCDYS